MSDRFSRDSSSPPDGFTIRARGRRMLARTVKFLSCGRSRSNALTSIPVLVERSRRSITSSLRRPNIARAPIPMAITTTRPPTAATSIVGSRPAGRFISDLHLAHLPHPEEADEPAADRVAQDVMADVLGEEGHDVLAVREQHEQQRDERQGADDVAGHASLGGQTAQLALELLAAANGVRDLLDDLDEVTARLLLHDDGEREDLEVLVVG